MWREGVQRGLVSDIIGRFEKRGYQLVALKMVHPSRERAERHYVRDLRCVESALLETRVPNDLLRYACDRFVRALNLAHAGW